MDINELNSALVLSRKIDRLQARLDDLRQTGGVGGIGNNTPVQGGSGVFVGQVVAELAQEIEELKSKLVIEKEIIRRELAKIQLEDVEYRVIELRYVDGWMFKHIQNRVGYSKSQTFRVHETALQKIMGGELICKKIG